MEKYKIQNTQVVNRKIKTNIEFQKQKKRDLSAVQYNVMKAKVIIKVRKVHLFFIFRMLTDNKLDLIHPRSFVENSRLKKL